MASETRSAKRPRCDDTRTRDQITRSKYWFDDGNIILQAENTQFKVHRSILSNQSIVFRDMFSMPQPVILDPVVDGCPVVFLSDSADDLELVMCLFYDNFKIYNMGDFMPYPLVAAVLRIGKKYQIDHFQAEGLKRLRKELPSDLDSWDACYNTEVAISGATENLANIINLAHELSVYSILPAAYMYYLRNESMDAILDGRKPNDVTDEHTIEAQTIRLNEKAMRQCLEGRDAVIRRFLDIAKYWLLQHDLIPSPSCSQKSECLKRKAKAILSLEAMSFRRISVLAPWSRSSLCTYCDVFLEEAYDTARQLIWDELPRYFGLPPWDELVDFA